jgi:hypothetical protein
LEETKRCIRDGSVAKTEEENADAVRQHFEEEVFARTSVYDQEAIDSLDQRECADHLGQPPTFDEFKTALKRMKRRKASGDSGIPAEAYQMMDDESIGYLHNALVRFRKEPDFDPTEWHTVVLKV